MTATTEALALVALVANGERYRERLQELSQKQAEVDAAVANLNAVSKASSDKLETEAALLGSLTAQADAITTANAEATASRVAAENDLSRRVAELEAAKAAHADEVARALQEHASRESDLKQRQSVLDADFHRRLEDLRGVENNLRDHHSGLRSIIASARQGLAAAS